LLLGKLPPGLGNWLPGLGARKFPFIEVSLRRGPDLDESENPEASDLE
jgi:hypothetical protein